MDTRPLSVPGASDSARVVLPETVEEARAMGLDVDLAVSCGCLWLNHAMVAKRLITEPADPVAAMVAAGLLQPTTAKGLLMRYNAATAEEQKEFRDLLLKQLRGE